MVFTNTPEVQRSVVFLMSFWRNEKHVTPIKRISLLSSYFVGNRDIYIRYERDTNEFTNNILHIATTKTAFYCLSKTNLEGYKSM